MTSISSPAVEPNLAAHCRQIAERARQAAIELADVAGPVKQAALRAAAVAIRSHTAAILQANAIDLAAAPGFGLTTGCGSTTLGSRGSPQESRPLLGFPILWGKCLSNGSLAMGSTSEKCVFPWAWSSSSMSRGPT